MARLSSILAPATLLLCLWAQPAGATLRFADVVLDYFDSGAGPIPGPYGGTTSNHPVPVSLDVVLGDEPGPSGLDDFLSLPTGSFVVVGFTDESIVG